MIAGLYPQLLGPRWRQLAESVQRLHGKGRTISAAGVFRVRHGANRLACLVARLARLPLERDAVDLRLQITRSRRGERWQRLFAGRPFTSTQWARDGLLVEQAGLVEMRFKLEIIDGALHYRSMSTALRLGPVRIVLPSWLAPRVTASEEPHGNAVYVAVKVHLPFLGVLIAYEGRLSRLEEKPC